MSKFREIIIVSGLLTFVGILILLAACGGDKSVSPQPTYESFTVGKEARVITTADSVISLSFPASALANDTTITIGVQNTYPSNAGYVSGTCYTFGPNGLEFLQPVTLTIKFHPQSVPSGITENTLRINKIAGNTWQQLTSNNVDTSLNEVSSALTGFSSYGIIGRSGNIYNGDYVINSEARKLAFSQYSGISGNLTITASDSLMTLDSLDLLTWVGGTLTLGHSYYDSVPMAFGNGLSGLVSIGGGLTLSEKTITAATFPSLTSIGGMFIISGIKLESLDFPHLAAVGAWLRVSGTRVLPNFNGLEALTTVGKGIYIESTHGLLSLEGIEHIGGEVDSVYIGANRDLQSLHGLEGITYINKAIEINNNDALTTLQGFDASYAGSVTIAYNDALTTLEHLIHLSRVGKGGLNIAHQYNLNSLHGLESLGQLEGNFSLWYCSSLDTIDAPNHLITLDGIHLNDCGTLVSLKAFETITHTKGSIIITDCNALRDISGLRNITSIGRDLILQSDAMIPNLNALQNIHHVGATDSIQGGGVWLEGNVRLDNIEGLENLQTDPVNGFKIPGYLIIIGNVMTDVSAWQFVGALGGESAIRDTIIIRNNGY
jgi:hypothetical protein